MHNIVSKLIPKELNDSKPETSMNFANHHTIEPISTLPNISSLVDVKPEVSENYLIPPLVNRPCHLKPAPHLNNSTPPLPSIRAVGLSLPEPKRTECMFEGPVPKRMKLDFLTR